MTEPELDDEYGDDDSSNDEPKPSWFAMHVWYPVYYAFRLWRVGQVWRVIARWWHCLRFGMLPLGQWIQIESVKVCGEEQLAGSGSVPGSMFSPFAITPILGTVVQPAQLIQLQVRNVGRKRVRFKAVVQLLANDGRFQMLPFSFPLLEVNELTTVTALTNHAARIGRIVIAEYVPKERRKPNVARETQQKVEQ